jgi:actin related protein 2/3 complex, subunit 2
VDIRCADFDGVLYHLSTVESKTVLLLSLAWKCWPELQAAGAEEVLNSEYKDLVVAPEQGHNYSLRIDLATLPATPAERSTSQKLSEGMSGRAAEAHCGRSGGTAALAVKLSLLKRHAIAAPFYRAFDAQKKGQTSPLFRISYRDDEAIWVRAFPDRVTAIFSTMFKDETDVIVGKVFLQVRGGIGDRFKWAVVVGGGGGGGRGCKGPA